MAKTKVTWMVDSGSIESLHVNGGGSYVESLLGRVVRRDEEWFFIEKDGTEHGPFRSLTHVKREAMRIVDGEYI